jgi:two-component system response regulator RegA
VSEELDRTLLIVDDDDAFRERLSQAFQKRRYQVRAVPNGALAVQAAEEESPELAIVDLRLPGEWGLHIVRELLRVDPGTRIVMLTAYGSIATALEAVRLGARGYLQKPATVDEIEIAFRRLDDEPIGAPDAPAEVPSLARAEWEHINRVLTECDGNIRKAARLLGLHRRTLQRKLAKFPVTR